MKPFTNDLGLGYIRVDEDFLGITRLALSPGGITIWARRTGPAPAVSGAYRIFTTEGQPVTDNASGEVGTVDIPRLERDQVFDLKLVLTMDNIQGGKTKITR